MPEKVIVCRLPNFLALAISVTDCEVYLVIVINGREKCGKKKKNSKGKQFDSISAGNALERGVVHHRRLLQEEGDTGTEWSFHGQLEQPQQEGRLTLILMHF